MNAGSSRSEDAPVVLIRGRAENLPSTNRLKAFVIESLLAAVWCVRTAASPATFSRVSGHQVEGRNKWQPEGQTNVVSWLRCLRSLGDDDSPPVRLIYARCGDYICIGQDFTWPSLSHP